MEVIIVLSLIINILLVLALIQNGRLSKTLVENEKLKKEISISKKKKDDLFLISKGTKVLIVEQCTTTTTNNNLIQHDVYCEAIVIETSEDKLKVNILDVNSTYKNFNKNQIILHYDNTWVKRSKCEIIIDNSYIRDYKLNSLIS